MTATKYSPNRISTCARRRVFAVPSTGSDVSWIGAIAPAGRIWSLVFFLALFVLTPDPLQAQSTKPNPDAPVLSSAFPMGMQRGTTLELTLTGKNLADPTGVLCTFPCKVTIPTDKNNGRDATKLRVRLQAPADAPIGYHLIRLATNQGMSNPRMFCIDSLPQVVEIASNRDKAKAQMLSPPCIVAGRIDAVSSDFYKIKVKMSDELSFDVLARRLGSSLDPQISIWSAKSGRELAYVNDSPGMQTDCRLLHKFKEADEYLIEIKDVLNRGGSDYFYRLRVGDFSLATTPIPLAARRGSGVFLGFTGLSKRFIDVDFRVPDVPGQEEIWVQPGDEHSWPVSLLVSEWPEKCETELKDQSKAQPIAVPSGVTGLFQKREDTDRFQFTAKKGQKLIIQAQTFELSSPALVYMTVRDGKGKELAKTKPEAKPPADQIITFTPPADGDYVVEVQHLNFIGGPQQIYHLTITPPQRDFSISLALDSWDAAPGETRLLPLKVTRNSFAGPIDVQVTSTHPGITGKTTIGTSAKTGHLLLRVNEDVPIGPYPLQLKATAKLGKQTMTHYVSVRDSLQSALAGLPLPPRNLNKEAALAVTPKTPFRLQVAFATPEAVPGLNATIKITLERDKGFDGAVTLLPPDGVPGKVKLPKIPPIAKGKDSTQFTIKLDPKTPLGQHPIVIRGKAKLAKNDISAYADPAPLVVTRPFALQIEPAKLTIKQGDKTNITIKALRKGGYSGPIKLQVRNLPKGVSASAVTIAKGKDQADVTVTAANSAAVGAKNDVNILGTATAAANQQQTSPNISVTIMKK